MVEKQTIRDTKVSKYLPQIVRILEKSFANRKAKVYLFGSRIRNEDHFASDFDLAIESDGLKKFELVKLKELFQESTIPYKVDVVCLNKVHENLRTEINHEGILIWES